MMATSALRTCRRNTTQTNATALGWGLSAARSCKSCSWSRVAAARYSSQIAWTRAGSRLKANSGRLGTLRKRVTLAFSNDPRQPDEAQGDSQLCRARRLNGWTVLYGTTAIHVSFNISSAKYPEGGLTLEGGVP